MHLSAETLDTTTTAWTTIAGAAAFAGACYGARRERKGGNWSAFLGMSGLVFLGHMINCATGFGFSGHLVGTALLAICFGPFSAMFSMGLILATQIAFLGDGAWSSLGANFINMGVVAAGTAYGLQVVLKNRRALPEMAVLGASAAASVSMAALSLGLMLGPDALPALLLAHAPIAVLEAGLSVGIFLLGVRSRGADEVPSPRLAWQPLAILCVAAVCLIPLSSPQPDGLEHTLIQISGE